MKKIIIYSFFILAFSPVLSQNADLLSKYYFSGEFEKAYEQSSQLVKEYPDKPELVVMHGRVLVDLGRYNDGKEFLEKAISLDKDKSWISAWAWAYLGQAYFMTEDYELSKKALMRCMELNSTENVNIFAKKRMLLFGFDNYFNDWRIIETNNLRFHIQMPSNINNLQQFIQQREATFLKINKIFDVKLPKKIDFFVWNDYDEPKIKLNLILGFANPDFVSVYTQINQTKAHEITHIITHYIGKSKIKTGLINEGTAVYFNENKDDKFELVIKYLIKNNISQISIKDLWENWNMINQELSYPLAGAFILDFVNKFGIEGLKKILIDQSYANSKKEFGEEIDKLINTFESKINNELKQRDKLNSSSAINKSNKRLNEYEPLYFVNGKEISLAELQKINRNDIDTVEFIIKKEEIEKITSKNCNMIHLIRTKK